MQKTAEKKMVQGSGPYDKDWGTGTSGQTENPSPFPRINAWRKQFLNTPLRISADRAMLWTGMLQKNKGKPRIVRNAEPFAHVLKNVPIEIGTYELLLGNMAAPPRTAPVFPEFSYEWLIHEMENAPFEKRDGDRFLIDEEAKKCLKRLRGFWKNETVHDYAKSLMTEGELKGTGAYGRKMGVLNEIVRANGLFSVPSHAKTRERGRN